MRRILVALLATAFALTTVTAAHAGEKAWTDPRGGEGSYLDIYSASVRNTSAGVLIRFRIHPVDWMAYSPAGDLLLKIDTGGSAGPEFSFRMGIPGDGGLVALKGTRAWKRKWQQDPTQRFCGRSVAPRMDMERGVHRLLIKPKRGCLYHPKRVRIYMRTVEVGYYTKPNYVGYVENNPPIHDYFPTARNFTSWVKYTRR